MGKANPRTFFEGIRHIGHVQGPRSRYEVYDVRRGYLLMSQTNRGGWIMSDVPRSYVDNAFHKFRGKTTNSSDVRKRLGGSAFKALNALYALSAEGRARVVGKEGKSILFKVNRN